MVNDMISEKLVQSLHDKSTRGEILTVEEQLLLTDWYESQDKLEAEMLGTDSVIPENATQYLQIQIKTGLEKLVAVTQQIQRIISENEALRHEISVLQNQLIRQTA